MEGKNHNWVFPWRKVETNTHNFAEYIAMKENFPSEL